VPESEILRRIGDRQEAQLRRHRTKEAALAYKGGRCSNCGYGRSPKALEFHHPDPLEKDFSISDRLWASEQELMDELDKTVLLCSNCHREAHDGMHPHLYRDAESVTDSMDDPYYDPFDPDE
jgi:ribosomal protein L37E